MKAYLITSLVIDMENIGIESIKSVIENTRYRNDVINPDILDILETDIGELSDDHLLNKTSDKDVIKQSYQWSPIS